MSALWHVSITEHPEKGRAWTHSYVVVADSARQAREVACEEHTRGLEFYADKVADVTAIEWDGLTVKLGARSKRVRKGAK